MSLVNPSSGGGSVTSDAIATALGGTPLLDGGAGGTPSSMTGTNITGIPPAGVTGTAAILGANTFTAKQTITPANNAAALTLSANTTPVGAITTTGATTVTGTSTKFLSQIAAGDTITPSGESARVVSYVVSDTSLVLTAVASGSHSGVSYTITPVGASVNPNGYTSYSPSASSGSQSERYGMGAIATGDSSLAVGNLASTGSRQTSIALGKTATAGADNSIAIGATASATGGIAIGFGAATNDGGNSTSIAIGHLASASGFQSIVLGRKSGTNNTATADGQFIVGSDVLAAARITDVWIGGGRVSGTPVGVTYHGTGGTGSNIVGSNVAIAGGISTGTGAGGNVQIQTAPTLQSTGSTANSLVDRRIVVAAGKALTSGVAASLVDIALPTLKMAGGKLRYNVICTDGTDMQALAGEVIWSAVNKGGSYTVSIKAPNGATADDSTAAKSVSAGTITISWALTSGSNKVTIQPTVTTSLTATTFRIYYAIDNDSDQAITAL